MRDKSNGEKITITGGGGTGKEDNAASESSDDWLKVTAEEDNMDVRRSIARGGSDRATIGAAAETLEGVVCRWREAA
ncbi:hypothetical protein MAPG_09847 [Magnaporthiopsis poae ATCC 64411]|uniref:Uncharacterized protein n=1 Tax=Magnaporthiopsis poae (strain ATCC 64411 / 73-15) TaxID=644358 RepID=A0A0C4EB07_MAGP6|nr:hypothetical protein MAPG_09847 [Magnaporthiopsis poae ATCC 64411]